MTIERKWYDEEKTILHYEFHDGWQWAELQEIFATAYDLIDTVEHRVDVIMDFTEGWNIPQGAVNEARRAFNKERHPRIGLTVLVGNRFVKSLADLVKKFIGKASENWPIEMATSLNEAIAIIRSHRGTETP